MEQRLSQGFSRRSYFVGADSPLGLLWSSDMQTWKAAQQASAGIPGGNMLGFQSDFYGQCIAAAALQGWPAVKADDELLNLIDADLQGMVDNIVEEMEEPCNAGVSGGEGTAWAQKYFYFAKFEVKGPRIYQGQNQGGNRILVNMWMTAGNTNSKRAFEELIGAMVRGFGGPEASDNRRPQAPLPSERYLWATGAIPQLPPMGRGGPAV